jgi:hypothetical protein
LVHDGGKGIGKKKSIVAIARRLAELMYTLLKNGTEYEVRKFEGGKETGQEKPWQNRH